MGFLCGSAGKESACNAGDLGSISGLGRSPGEGKGYPLQDSGLENSMDCIVHGVAKSDTTEQLSLHFFNVGLPHQTVSSIKAGPMSVWVSPYLVRGTVLGMFICRVNEQINPKSPSFTILM